MTTTFVLGQNIGFCLELGVRLHRTGLAQNLATLNVFTLRATQQRANVIASLTLIKQLAEHFNARHRRLHSRLQTDNLNFLTNLHNAALNTTCHNRTATRNREHVFNRHQEGLINRTLRLRNISINRRHQLQNRLAANLRAAIFQSAQGRTLGDRNIIAREIIFRQQLTHLKLNQIEQFGIVNHVNLVHEHNKRRNANLAGQQNVLTGLRHRAISCRHNQNRAIHLRRAGDHVLHIVSMAGAINVRIVTIARLIFNVRCRNGNATRLFFGRLVNLIIGRKCRTARFSQNLRNRCRQ